MAKATGALATGGRIHKEFVTNRTSIIVMLFIIFVVHASGEIASAGGYDLGLKARNRDSWDDVWIV
jgi:hypothetical protein